MDIKEEKRSFIFLSALKNIAQQSETQIEDVISLFQIQNLTELFFGQILQFLQDIVNLLLSRDALYFLFVVILRQ